MPEEEITKMINMLQEGRVTEMFDFTVSYDVQKVRQESKLEGIKEGIKEKAVEMAEKMVKYGEPVEKIAEYTGLAKEEIERLKKKIYQ